VQDRVIERAMPLDLPVDGDEPDHPGEVRIVALHQRQQEQRATEPAIAILKGVDRQEAEYEFRRDQQGPGMLADCLIVPVDQVPHGRLGLRSGWGRVEHDPTLAGVVIDRDDLVRAGLVAAGIEPGSRVEAEQGVVQAADGALRQWKQLRSLKVDDAQTFAAADDLLDAPLAVFGQFIQNAGLIGVEGCDVPILREGGVQEIS